MSGMHLESDARFQIHLNKTRTIYGLGALCARFLRIRMHAMTFFGDQWNLGFDSGHGDVPFIAYTKELEESIFLLLLLLLSEAPQGPGPSKSGVCNQDSAEYTDSSE
jgi:hypothetical protein